MPAAHHPIQNPKARCSEHAWCFHNLLPTETEYLNPNTGKEKKKKNMKTHNTIKNKGQKSNENLGKADATLSDIQTERRKENKREKEGNDEEQDKEKINWKTQKKNVMLVINIY